MTKVNSTRFRRLALLFLLLVAAGAGSRRADAQPCRIVGKINPQTVQVVGTQRGAPPARAGLGSTVRIRLRVPDGQNPNFGTLQLYLDGHPIPGQTGIAVEPRQALCSSPGVRINASEVQHEFTLSRTAESRERWGHLLGSPTSFAKTMNLGAGLPNQPELNWIGERPRVAFTVVQEWPFWIALLAFAGVLVLLWSAGRRTNLLRDDVPDGPVGTRRPYSLSKVVMAMWTVLILAGFFLIWLIVGDPGGIFTAQAFLLLGIVGAATTMAAGITRNQAAGVTRNVEEMRLRAVAVRAEAESLRAQLHSGAPAMSAEAAGMEVMKGNAIVAKAEEVLRHEEATTIPVSRGFFTDLISDGNGPSVSRFQNLAWNVAFGIVFVVGAYRLLALPVFDNEVLALLGISEALYLGVKLNSPLKAPAQETPAQPSLAARMFPTPDPSRPTP